LSTNVRTGRGCPAGATPPIGWPVWSRTNLRARGQHQQRFDLVTVGGLEDQAVRDRADRHPQGVRGGRRGADVVGQQADAVRLLGHARFEQRGGELGDGRMGHGCNHTMTWVTAA
jgi:hypothetical protein